MQHFIGRHSHRYSCHSELAATFITGGSASQYVCLTAPFQQSCRDTAATPPRHRRDTAATPA
eukprot:11813538-Heterocapsa_arctica.AAC.1